MNLAFFCVAKMEAKVTLLQGRGAKKQYDGRVATLGRRLGGGWTAVTPVGCDRLIKWRTQHWDNVVNAPDAAASSGFGGLPTDCVLQVLARLAVPEVCSVLQTSRALSALGAEDPFSQCHLRDGLPAGFGVRPSKQLCFARMLGDTHAQLRSMHIDHGRDELDVVCWLLQECDTSALARVTINCETATLGQMTLPLLELAGTSAAGPIDVYATEMRTEAARHLGFFTERLRPQTRRTITGALAQFCPALTSLILVKRVEGIPSLGAIKSLQKLETHFKVVDDISYLLTELPNLTHLTISMRTFTAGDVDLDLESASLQVLDITRAGKGFALNRIACPSLREIVCKDYEGFERLKIVARVDGAHVVWEPSTVGYNPRDLCVFGLISLSGNIRQIRSLVDVVAMPADCAVVWDRGAKRATASMTLGEVAAAWAAEEERMEQRYRWG